VNASSPRSTRYRSASALYKPMKALRRDVVGPDGESLH
jgi:hypothetical protein